jgi:hypothetical protein
MAKELGVLKGVIWPAVVSARDPTEEMHDAKLILGACRLARSLGILPSFFRRSVGVELGRDRA